MVLRARRRSDVLMLVIGVFVLSGGILVYQSFAAKRFNTAHPGNYEISGIAQTTQDGPDAARQTTYHLAVTKDHEYCFWGTHGDGATVSITSSLPIEPASGTESFQTANEKVAILICATATQSASEADFTLATSGAVAISALSVDATK